MADTRARLKDAALRTLVERGIAGTSARTIAEAAGVSQGLVFYHFDSVIGLLATATGELTARRAAEYRDRLAGVSSLTELAGLARRLHDEDQRRGDVAVMAQLLAGAQTHPELVPVARDNYRLLADEVHTALDRLVADHPLAGRLPAGPLADLVSATFLGVELLPGSGDGGRADRVFDTLVALARLVDAAAQLGPAATAILRRQLPDATDG